MTDLPPVSTLELDLQSGWLTVWFNQPKIRNALTSEMTADLRRTLEAVREDRAVRGITLRGRGGFFCAGGDLKSFDRMAEGGMARDDIRDFSVDAGRLFALVNGMPQVVVGVVEGAAYAGGLGLVCCCDVLIAEADAKFATTEVMIGLSPAQIARFIVDRVGLAKARRLLITGERFDGRQAMAFSMVDFIGDDATELDAIEAKVRSQVLRCGPEAVEATKALLLRVPFAKSPDDAILDAANVFADRLSSAEGQEGVRSFVEKRKPAWAAK